MKHKLIISALILLVGCARQESEKEKSVSDREALSVMQSIYGNTDRGLFSNNELQRGRPNQDAFYHTVANGYADQLQDSKGLASEVRIIKLQTGKAKIKSWWINMRYSYFATNFFTGVSGTQNDWIQWGYATHKDFGLIPAFFVYHISGPLGSGYFTPTIVYLNTTEIAYTTETVRFEIRHKPGTTFWILSRGGIYIMEVDLKVDHTDGQLAVATESWGDDSFPTILDTKYLHFYRDGQWQPLPRGQIKSAYWGIEGQALNSALAPSQVIFGGKPSATFGLLWLIY